MPDDPTSTASTDADTGSEAGTCTSTTAEPTAGSASESGTSGLADGCDALTSEEPCEAVPGCAAVHGIAQAFAGCTFGSHFLGCIDEAPCDAVVLTICRDGTGEVYEIGDGCIPPDPRRARDRGSIAPQIASRS